jgi:hypothetical protein
MEETMGYDLPPLSHMQKQYYRGDLGPEDLLMDHIVRRTDELNQERINRIPARPLSDWQDLPNISLVLPSGSKVHKIVHKYRTANSTIMDAICRCSIASKSKNKKADCDFKENQSDDTLVPRFCAHTFWRSSNNWDGVFGRVPFNGVFKTVLTNPSPASTLGRVLHPYQHRQVLRKVQDELASSILDPDHGKMRNFGPDLESVFGSRIWNYCLRQLLTQKCKC